MNLFTDLKPVITHPPVMNHLAALGQTVTINCSVTGSPKPVITWLKDGHLIEDSRVTYEDNKQMMQIQVRQIVSKIPFPY